MKNWRIWRWFRRRCFTWKTANPVVPMETSQPADGYLFEEVKPGRILRVRHIVPDRAVVEKPSSQGGIVSCKRKITAYRTGQLFIEKLYDRAKLGLKTSTKSRKVTLSQHSRKGRRKRTVVVDCERTISACKETHADVALFFIHGVGGSLDIWGNQLDFFSRLGYEVIAPDLIGHGESSAPQITAAYSFYALAEDMKIIFKKYARKRNILIGHSYGVSLCTFLAHEFPQQIHKMVLINGGGPTSLEPETCSIFNLPTCALHCLSPLLTWGFLKKGFVRQGAREKRLLKENNAFNVSPFVLRAMMNGQYWPEGDEVYHAEITVPTLVVHGRHDKFVSIEGDKYMAEILSIASLKVLENGSHMVMLECPNDVNTVLHEYFLWEPATLPRPQKESMTGDCKSSN